jgi:geranyl-CoA carboxylase alpha subunit
VSEERRGPFRTLLIANRGEIAVRIARTARGMGYRTVAVYSDVDAGMPHVSAADAAVCIGAAPAAQSYLCIDRLIDAARRTGADAVHPGYGFLSENADFAQACHAAGLVFIGPPSQAIRAMADKAESKRLMLAAGVPCVPGYEGDDQSPERLAAEAGRIGLPLMIKAVAGGGGKGMRLVARAAEFAAELAAARSEALKAFGRGEVLLERALAAPRHVEVQVFGDSHGNVLHLGDRDCSIQRRHQKVIEEAPAPGLDPALRQRMAQAAVAAARAVGYVGAGTVEFLLDAAGGFHFLEMNTRLQVEHAVTEQVTGIDLVEWQLRVASGEPLPLRQEEVTITGHAIEARLYAEDPAADFVPQSGTLVAWQPPVGPGLRVDHGVRPGLRISTFYDPMIAKVIGSGRDRAEAARRLTQALEEVVLAGLPTNRAFLVACLAHPEFAAARLSTAFIPTHRESLSRAPPDAGTIAAAAAMFIGHDAARHPAAFRHWHSSPWDAQSVALDCGGWSGRVHVQALSADRYVIEIDGTSATVDLPPKLAARCRIAVDGVEEDVLAVRSGAELFFRRRGADLIVREQAAGSRLEAVGGRVTVRSPMPGSVVALGVGLGARVDKGGPLMTLGAMKMELKIVSPVQGTVVAIHVAAEQQIPIRCALLEIEPD